MLKSLPFYQVDAFAEESFTGNPAAVIIMDEFLTDEVLQKMAIENNLSETAFLVKSNDHHWHLRWFTPAYEVDLCGHATLASAHVLFTEGFLQKEVVSFSTRSGVLQVSKTDDYYEMIFPADFAKTVEPPSQLKEVLNIPIVECLRGKDDFLVIVEKETQVANLNPDFRLIAQLPSRGLIVSAPGDAFDFVSRCFYPQAGVDEDPVTGSAHTLMIPYWANQLNKKKLAARQISSRGGNIQGWLAENKVHLLGKGISVIKGQFTIYK